MAALDLGQCPQPLASEPLGQQRQKVEHHRPAGELVVGDRPRRRLRHRRHCPLSIYAGHFGDLLFHAVGFPDKLTAITETQFPHVTIVETGEKVPYTAPNEVMVIGTLEGGGLFSVQLEGAQRHRTGLHLDITGTNGVLRVTNPRGFENEDDNTVEGMTGDAAWFAPLPVPAEYQYLGRNNLDASVQDVAYLYATYARDLQNGTSKVTDFHDAVRMHHLIDHRSVAENLRRRGPRQASVRRCCGWGSMRTPDG